MQKTTGTMDLTNYVTPRYMDCMSGIEDLYSDTEAARSQPQRRHRNLQHKPDIEASDIVYDSW